MYYNKNKVFSGTLADQWKDIITAGHFDEHTVGKIC